MVKIFDGLNRQPRTLQKFFLAKFFVPLSKRSVSTNFLGSFWKIEFLMENWQRRTLQKWWKFCTITNVLRIFFLWQMFLFHSSKEVFLQTFRQFLENWIFDGKSTAADLTKMVKICTISKCAQKIFFGKILCSTHQKKCFYKLLGSFLENWIFDGKSTAADLTKMVKILYYLKMCSENILWQNSLFHSAKEVFLQTFWQFLENWIFDGKSTAADLTKMVKICTISKCAKKIFFVKILCSTHQKKCFYKLLGSFWKIEFLTENRQPRPLQKWWKFCTISKCAKKTFFGKISLLHSSKEVFLQTFKHFL